MNVGRGRGLRGQGEAASGRSIPEPGPGEQPESYTRPTDRSRFPLFGSRGRGRAVPQSLDYPPGRVEAVGHPGDPDIYVPSQSDSRLSRSSSLDFSEYSDITSDTESEGGRSEAGQSDVASMITTVSSTHTTTTASNISGSGTAVSKKSDLYQELASKQPIVESRGTKGESTSLESNFLRIVVDENKGLFQYVVRIEPEVEDVRRIRRILRENESVLGKAMVYDDQGMLFLPHCLLHENMKFTGVDPSNNNAMVDITISLVKKIQMADSIQFYNILMNRVNSMLGLKPMKGSYFNFSSTHTLGQHKLEIWPGYQTSIDEYEGGLLLNIDTTSRVLRTTTVWDLYNDLRKEGLRQEEFRAKFTETVIGSIVITRHTKRHAHYKIDDIDWNSNVHNTFNRKGQEVSYWDYYKSQYNIEIKDASQPILLSNSTKKSLNSDEVVIFSLFPELCYQTGMSEAQRTNFTVMKDVAEYTRLGPKDRQKAIKAYISNINANDEAKGLLDSWGINLKENLVRVNGRLIEPPKIEFGNKRQLAVAADFSRESTSGSCYEPIEIKSWNVYCTKFDRELTNKMVDTYCNVAKSLGIRISAPPRIIEVVPSRGRTISPSDLVRQIKDTVTKDTQVLIAIFPGQRDDLYSAFKKYSLTENAIASQVILSKTLKNDKRLRSILQKVCLQINCKLGGAIWSLSNPLKEKYLFIGFDVHHDPKRKLKSAFSIVACLNNNCTKYFSNVNFHPPHQESVEKMKELFKMTLKAYFQGNGFYPDYIIVYRDGVGDGQLKHVKNTEVAQLQSACEELGIDKVPKITYIVVQKRIVERFLLKSGGSYDNAKPGTVVDHTVTKDWLFDFFIVSQIARQGTITPTHFIVVHDESKKGPDMLQKFSYVLTFMYFNWPGTIRVPAPCQYAHKLAFLAGEHLLQEPQPQVSNTLFYL